MGTTGNRVVVIGAGIAGLVTAKVLRADGFEVLVFEKEPQFGGVWIESRTYPGLRTNNSRDTYAFSDHPYPESADTFPAAAQVRAYLASYAERFGLVECIRLSTEVVRVERAEDGFEIDLLGPDGPETVRSDFVVVCSGVFSEPQLPVIDGADRFDGVLVHSSQATDPALFTGRRVVVVGAGKSALDCAAWAGARAETCTLVFRKPYYMAPRYLPGGAPFDRFVGRGGELFLPYHHMDRLERFLHGPGAPVTRLFWQILSFWARTLLRMPRILVPDRPLPHGIENAGVGQDFYDMARLGRIRLRRDTIAGFTGGDGIRLAGGDRIDADVIVFATGWRQSAPFLTPELHSAVQTDGRYRLYRHILAPTEQRLGFIGFASSVACQLSAEISAHWLSQSFRGELGVPPLEDMLAEIARVAAWLGEVMPGRPEGYFIGPYLSHHIDDLMRDMGLPTRRTGNLLTEYLGVLLPGRYRGITEERSRVREGLAPQRSSQGSSVAQAVGALAVLGSAYALIRHFMRGSAAK
ncbi:NAD(P)/FAD-dependent oxidoreductase [Nocardia sp. NPDC051030]|uniref:flavin-containing monooxygenase n=1 Tax=Nocardia sp. NPDC051030 TaxID=3155162 RepID=UPI003432AC2C